MENEKYTERVFIVKVLEEDLAKKFKDDLEGHIRGAIGDLLGFDADIGFSVEEVDKEEDDSTRTCTACGAIMTEGYCVGDGESYYCSDECLHKEMTEEEYMDLYNNDCAYWTEWR
ncbi:MAG: hypothetical protein JXN65_03495 [Clostridia bacterium]|nr:hypothetical protein [Clostridia bacterium]